MNAKTYILTDTPTDQATGVLAARLMVDGEVVEHYTEFYTRNPQPIPGATVDYTTAAATVRAAAVRRGHTPADDLVHRTDVRGAIITPR